MDAGRLIEGHCSNSDERGQCVDHQGVGGMVRSGQSLKIKPVRSSDWLYVSGKEKNQG